MVKKKEEKSAAVAGARKSPRGYVWAIVGFARVKKKGGQVEKAKAEKVKKSAK